MSEEKKDLTSIFDLSKREMELNPTGAGQGSISIEMPELPKLSENEFGSIEELSHSTPALEVPQVSTLDPTLNNPVLEQEPEPTAEAEATDSTPASLEFPAVDFSAPPSEAAEPAEYLSTQPEPPEMPAFEPVMAELSTPLTPLDPNRPVVNEPPVSGSPHLKKAQPDAEHNQNLNSLKQFAGRIAIGHPQIEASPAFSLLAKSQNGRFTEKQIKGIEDAITSEEFGIRLDEIKVQLQSGRLLVPQISEFAAITLAQKLRDLVDTIEIDLAAEIFKGSVSELLEKDEPFLMDTEQFEGHHEEVHDLGAEPKSADDLFSSNLSELANYQITRVLSIVTVSEIISANIAENPSDRDFERSTERLTTELINRAFKLGAHGILGVNFTLRPIDAHKDADGGISRGYRIFGTGTAVRARKKP